MCPQRKLRHKNAILKMYYYLNKKHLRRNFITDTWAFIRASNQTRIDCLGNNKALSTKEIYFLGSDSDVINVLKCNISSSHYALCSSVQQFSLGHVSLLIIFCCRFHWKRCQIRKCKSVKATGCILSKWTVNQMICPKMIEVLQYPPLQYLVGWHKLWKM